MESTLDWSPSKHLAFLSFHNSRIITRNDNFLHVCLPIGDQGEKPMHERDLKGREEWPKCIQTSQRSHSTSFGQTCKWGKDGLPTLHSLNTWGRHLLKPHLFVLTSPLLLSSPFLSSSLFHQRRLSRRHLILSGTDFKHLRMSNFELF